MAEHRRPWLFSVAAAARSQVEPSGERWLLRALGSKGSMFGASLGTRQHHRNRWEIPAGWGAPAAQAEAENGREQKYISEKMERKYFSKE